MFKNKFRFQYFALSLLLVSSILGTARLAYSATGQLIPNNTPPFVESAPKAIKTGITKDEANTIKAKVEEAGAKVEIK